MRAIKSRAGFGLLLLVGLIAVSGIVLTSSLWFFANEMRQIQLRIDQTKAHYLAQAGVMRAAWNWYTANTTVEGSRRWSPINTTVTGSHLFKAGMTSAGVYLQSNYAYIAPISHTGIVNVKNVATAGNKTGGTTTLAVTVPAAGVAQGNFLVVYLAMDDGGGALLNPPAIDTQGNTYATASDVTYAGNVRTVILYALVETALVSGNTITARWTNNVTAKAMCVREFTGPTHLDLQATATGTLPGNAITSGPITPNYQHALVVSGVGIEGPSGDVFTVGAGYTLVTEASSGNTGLTDVTMNGQYRIVNAIAGYVGNGTNSVTTRDWASAVAAFYGKAHWFTSGANRRLRAWRIQNIHNASSITLTDIKVSWTGGGAAQLNDIRLNNTSVWPGGTAASGTTVNITDTALTFGSSWSGINTYLQWDNGGPADPTTVTCQFIFSGDSATTDAKTHEVVMWNGAHAGAGLPTERTFTVTATGQVNQNESAGNFNVLETVKATISGDPGLAALEITDWDEGDKNIP